MLAHCAFGGRVCKFVLMHENMNTIDPLSKFWAFFSRTWSQAGVQSLSVAGFVIQLSQLSPDVTLQPVNISRSDQILTFQQGTFQNQQLGKVLGLNLNTVRAYSNQESGAAIKWTLGFSLFKDAFNLPYFYSNEG